MPTPEDELEALLVVAELSAKVRDKLLTPEGRERLEAAGYEVTRDAWGDPIAKAAYEDTFKDAAAQLALLEVIGEEGALALDAAWRLDRTAPLVARKRVMELREQLILAGGQRER